MEFVISHKTKVAQMSPDMKITQVKSNGKSLKNIELPDVMTAIRSGEQARVVNEHRGILSSSMPGDRNIHATDIPVLLFAARFRKKESRIEYQVYNGLVLMDVGNLADREEAVEVKRLASLAPQTMAAFVGSSGKSVKILVPFVLPDGSLPEKRELAELFHAVAYRRALRRFDDERVQHHHLLRRGVKRPVCSCVAVHLRLIDTRGGDDRAVLLHDEEVVRIERLACSFLGGIDAANPADGRLAALFEVVCMVIDGGNHGDVRRSCFSECRHGKNFFLLRFLHATTRGASCQSLTGTAADGIIAPERRWLDGTANTAPAAPPVGGIGRRGAL